MPFTLLTPFRPGASGKRFSLATGGHAGQAWEPLVAGIMFTSIYAIVRIASAVYSGALLRGGERLTWRVLHKETALLAAHQRNEPRPGWTDSPPGR